MAIATGTALAISAGVAAAGTAATVISSQDAARKARNAVKDAQKIAGATEYQPIDIAELTRTANEQAIKNATDSLALERSLQPDVARARADLSKSVADQLAMGGNLPADVVNQVTNAARVTGGGSGTISASAPLTAQRLGISALNLLNQRQNNAANLLAANPLPSTGLDPGTVASLTAQENAAQNQFNLAKAGINTNLVQSMGQANAAQSGVNASNFASLMNLLTKSNGGGGGIDSDSILGKLGAAYSANNNPALNPSTTSAGYNFT